MRARRGARLRLRAVGVLLAMAMRAPARAVLRVARHERRRRRVADGLASRVSPWVGVGVVHARMVGSMGVDSVGHRAGEVFHLGDVRGSASLLLVPVRRLHEWVPVPRSLAGLSVDPASNAIELCIVLLDSVWRVVVFCHGL